VGRHTLGRLLNLKGERPWYFAISASAGIHLGFILVAAWIAIGVRATVRPTDLEASWAVAEPAESPLPVSSTVLELASRPNGDDKPEGGRNGGPLDSVAPLADAVHPTSQVSMHLPAASASLTSTWLAEARSTKGLTDLVGPVVYGANGRVSGSGGTGEAGNGTGSGFKATFFGIHAEARRIVYLVDASNSMNRPYDGEAKTRFRQVKLELAKSIWNLKAEQQFFVIFFNQHANPMPAEGMEHAYPANQQKYLTWMASVPAEGFTDPRPSRSLAFSLNPEVIYLLTDGLFPRDVQSDLSQLRQQTVHLNTIAFGDQKAEKSLKPLALRNHGQFAFVP
jgi:hypothetical protein